MTTLYEKTKSKTASINIMDRVKTFEDACEVLGIDKLQLGVAGLDDDRESIEAYAKLIIIAKVLNEGWQPDWSDDDQYKYFPWFKHKSGFGLSCFDFGRWRAYTAVGSRLCFKSAKLAEYAGTQFAEIYRDYLTIK